MLIKLSGESSNMEFEAKQLNGGYQIQLAKTERAKTTVEGRAAISMNENRTISGDLRWNPALISELKVSWSYLLTVQVLTTLRFAKC